MPIIDHALMRSLAGLPLEDVDRNWRIFGMTSPGLVYVGWSRLGFATKNQPDTAEAKALLLEPHRLLWVVRAGVRQRAVMVPGEHEAFVAGTFLGVVALIDREAKVALCWAQVAATSSEKWTYDPKRSNGQDQIDSDLAGRLLGATMRAQHRLAPALVDEPPAWLLDP